MMKFKTLHFFQNEKKRLKYIHLVQYKRSVIFVFSLYIYINMLNLFHLLKLFFIIAIYCKCNVVLPSNISFYFTISNRIYILSLCMRSLSLLTQPFKKTFQFLFENKQKLPKTHKKYIKWMKFLFHFIHTFFIVFNFWFSFLKIMQNLNQMQHTHTHEYY